MNVRSKRLSVSLLRERFERTHVRVEEARPCDGDDRHPGPTHGPSPPPTSPSWPLPRTKRLKRTASFPSESTALSSTVIQTVNNLTETKKHFAAMKLIWQKTHNSLSTCFNGNISKSFAQLKSVNLSMCLKGLIRASYKRVNKKSGLDSYKGGLYSRKLINHLPD